MFDLTQRDFGNILNRLGQLSALETHRFASLIGNENVQEPISTEDKSPRIVLKDAKDKDTLVSTSHPRYLLQGRVENADGLKHITITVDDEKPKVITVGGEEREDEKIMRHGDHVIFSAWVSLPDVNDPNFDESLPINVKAHFAGQVRDPNEVGLKVRRVSNCLLDPESKYRVVLLPLEGKREIELIADRDERNRLYSRWDKANRVVCEAVKGYKDPEPDGINFCQRFDCKYLKNWRANDFDRKIKNFYSGKEPSKPAEKAARIAASDQWPADLAIYGSFEDEGDKFFDVTVQFTDVLSRPLSNKWIDMYGSYEDPDYYIEGLTSKLKAVLPRVSGEIVDANLSEGTIEVDLKNKYHVFNDMDLLLYDNEGSQENPDYKISCEAKANVVEDVSVRFKARVMKCRKGIDRASVMKKWKNMHVISR